MGRLTIEKTVRSRNKTEYMPYFYADEQLSMHIYKVGGAIYMLSIGTSGNLLAKGISDLGMASRSQTGECTYPSS